MKIPRRFQILGTTYRVRIVERVNWPPDVADAVGTFDPRSSEINILEADQQAMETTFWHEVIHAALHAMGKDELYKDESLVDLLGAIIHQILTSAK